MSQRCDKSDEDIVVLRADVTRNLHVTDDNYIVTMVYRRQHSITLPRHDVPADLSRPVVRGYLAVQSAYRKEEFRSNARTKGARRSRRYSLGVCPSKSATVRMDVEWI